MCLGAQAGRLDGFVGRRVAVFRMRSMVGEVGTELDGVALSANSAARPTENTSGGAMD